MGCCGVVGHVSAYTLIMHHIDFTKSSAQSAVCLMRGIYVHLPCMLIVKAVCSVFLFFWGAFQITAACGVCSRLDVSECLGRGWRVRGAYLMWFPFSWCRPVSSYRSRTDALKDLICNCLGCTEKLKVNLWVTLK